MFIVRKVISVVTSVFLLAVMILGNAPIPSKAETSRIIYVNANAKQDLMLSKMDENLKNLKNESAEQVSEDEEGQSNEEILEVIEELETSKDEPIVQMEGIGESWENPYTNLQDAIDAANPGDQIWVAKGTYLPSKMIDGEDGPNYQSFILKSGIKLYGGFAGIETKLSERDPKRNVTILSGELGGGLYSSSVVYGSGINNVVLDGFSISDGKASDDYLPSSSKLSTVTTSHPNQFNGAGIYLVDSSITLENLNISGNVSGAFGGGLYVSGSDVAISNVNIQENTAVYGGGMAVLSNSTVTISDSSLIGNHADYEGGGIYSEESKIHLIKVSVKQNEVEGSGGGLYSINNSEINIEESSFSGNQSYHGGAMEVGDSKVTISGSTLTENEGYTSGGAISVYYSLLDINNTTITQNSSDDYYGGAIHSRGVTLNVKNSIIKNNSAPQGGGIAYGNSALSLMNTLVAENNASFGAALYEISNNYATTLSTNQNIDAQEIPLPEPSLTILNSTIANNQAQYSNGINAGDGIFVTLEPGNKYTVVNSIIWGNGNNSLHENVTFPNYTQPDPSLIDYQLMANIVGGFSEYEELVTGVIPDGAVIDVDPLLVDMKNGDYRLKQDSPALDAGFNDVISLLPEKDLDGNNRVANNKLDIGAYEYQVAITPEPELPEEPEEPKPEEPAEPTTPEKPTDVEKEPEPGKKLPDTSTSFYNWLVLGILMVIFGAIGMVLLKRRASKHIGSA